MAPTADFAISKMESKILNSKVESIDSDLYVNGKRICLDCFEPENIESAAMICVDQNKNEIGGKSCIQEFYEGKNIFITGGTGFLGKLLIEKLLRSCPGVDTLYLLVRPKRGKDIHTRVDDIFEDPIFEPLKKTAPKFRHKVVAVAGDCNAPGLGLSLPDRQVLADKVNIIFHSAATVKFDEPLRAALATNVLAPLHLLRLARDMRRCDVFMQVSTAYSNCHEPLIEEKIYPCPLDLGSLQNNIDRLTDAQIEEQLDDIISPWPNTYTFTKALSERELAAQMENIPVGIFRPAIVTSTAEEPINGWIDNMYGPTGFAVGCVTGVLRTVQCSASSVADIVPADRVVCGLLAAACDTARIHRESCELAAPPIYNYVSSVEARVTWDDFIGLNLRHIDKYPLNTAIWYFYIKVTKSAILYNLYKLFLHILPACILDGLALCVGQKPKMLKMYSKVHKFSSVISYFSSREFNFCNKRTRKLWDNTSDVDREIFHFSMADLNWEEYFNEYLLGIRRYIFKEPDETLPKAAIRWRRLYYLHQITRLVFFSLAVYTMWLIFSRFF